jgi:hypothetical protein
MADVTPLFEFVLALVAAGSLAIVLGVCSGPLSAGRNDRQRVPNSAEFKRYAEVARKLPKQQLGSDGFMWTQLAAQWDKVVSEWLPRKRSCPRAASEFMLRNGILVIRQYPRA